MKKKLTRLRALWLCHELWHWLSKNPEKDKHEWPRWIFNGGSMEEIKCECFACEFKERTDTCDETCIVPIFRYADSGCENIKSPYWKWEQGMLRRQNAKKISESSYKAYVKEGGKRAKSK